MPHAAGPSGEIDTGLACLLMLARYFGVAADGDQLRHQFARPGQKFGESEVLRSARHLGLKASEVRSRFSRLARTPLPAMALRGDGRYVVLAKADDERALIQDPAESRITAVPRAEFEAVWTGRLILFTKRAGRESDQGRFGLSWFIPAFVKYRRHLAEVLIASLFIQLLGLVAPLFTQVVIDKVLVHRAMTTLDVLAAGMLALIVFEVVLTGLRSYLFTHTSSRIDVELGARAFRHLLALPLAYFEARRVGDTVARLRELESIRQFLTGSPLTLLIDILFTGVFLVVMLFYSPVLTAVALAALPFYAAVSLVLTPMIRTRLHEKFNRGADSHAVLVECVSGVETVKALAVEPQMRGRWEEELAAYIRAGFRATHLASLAGQAASFINKVSSLAILWVGARLVMDGALTVGELIAFNMLASRVSGPVLRLVQLWQEFQQIGISVQRLGDVLNAPAEGAHVSGPTRLPVLAGRVSFEEVSFRYRPAGRPVLRGVTFHAQPGEMLGIVGRSGSGKSTIAKLIQRLYVPEAGRVLIDGRDAAQLDPPWLRRRVGIVLQESMLFNRSVRENIALSDPGLPLEAVVGAATLAGAHEFILELPEGYDAIVGEHGCGLSGGQRQRIAIARALVVNPPILILDEATSALDAEAERLFRRHLAQIRKGRTVFVIAHRVSMVRAADRILVIERGQIVEQGTHAELIRGGGQYASFCSEQGG